MDRSAEFCIGAPDPWEVGCASTPHSKAIKYKKSTVENSIFVLGILKSRIAEDDDVQRATEESNKVQTRLGTVGSLVPGW